MFSLYEINGMSLPSTGVIKFSNIQTVFGGANPVQLSEYYSNGSLGYTSGVAGIPTIGAIMNLSGFRGKSKAFVFSHTFTNAGATGRQGPTLSQCRSAYTTAAWTQDTTNNYYNMTTQGIQEWVVPATGIYNITANGAAGAGSGSYYGGKGASIYGSFSLTSGEVICIVVGQMGVVGPVLGGAGGGGSFVYKKSNTSLLIAAGGGGGGGHDVGFGGFGSSTTTPVSGGGNGNGGFSSIGYGGYGGILNGVTGDWNDAAGGGCGWNGDGGNGESMAPTDYIGYGGKGRSGNFIGGYHGQNPGNGSPGNGGFGGGGGSGGGGSSGGGGGGFTGGGGGNNWSGTGNPGHGGGQGAGSFNLGTNQLNTANYNEAHGSVTITANSSSTLQYIISTSFLQNKLTLDSFDQSTSDFAVVTSWENFVSGYLNASYRVTYNKITNFNLNKPFVSIGALVSNGAGGGYTVYSNWLDPKQILSTLYPNFVTDGNNSWIRYRIETGLTVIFKVFPRGINNNDGVFLSMPFNSLNTTTTYLNIGNQGSTMTVDFYINSFRLQTSIGGGWAVDEWRVYVLRYDNSTQTLKMYRTTAITDTTLDTSSSLPSNMILLHHSETATSQIATSIYYARPRIGSIFNDYNVPFTHYNAGTLIWDRNLGDSEIISAVNTLIIQ